MQYNVKVCGKKFALYLYKNHYLDEKFTISKKRATKLFGAFSKEFELTVSLAQVLNRSGSLLIYNSREITYHQKEMANLIKDEKLIDMVFDGRWRETKQGCSSSSNNNNNNESHTDVVSGLECTLCSIKFGDKERLEKHVEGEDHSFLQKFYHALRYFKNHQDLKFLIDDSPTIDNVIIRKDVPKTVQLKIYNQGNEAVTILAVQTKPNIPEVSFKPMAVPCKFVSGTVQTWELTVHCKKKLVLCFPILLKIKKKEAVQEHAVQLIFHSHDKAFDALHPVEPYQRIYKKRGNSYLEQLDDHVRLDFERETDKRLPLKNYRIPKDLFMLLNSNLKPSEGMEKNQQTQLDYIKSLIVEEDPKKSLTVIQNYTNLLKVMLHAEEHQLLRDVRNYDQENQTLKRVRNLIELEVRDLAERRPSILVSDIVQIREHKHAKVIYDGTVEQVNESSVYINFGPRFIKQVYVPEKKYYVSFTFNRYTLRAQHQAVELTKADNIDHVFFPKHLKNPSTGLDLDLEWFNKDIGNNPEQQQAVRAILKKSSMPAPYLIFGPPGTGKTMTVVECVKQVYQRTNEKVLICAPSNSAGNEIARRLLDTIKKGLYRYVSHTFSRHLPEDLKQYSNCSSGSCYQPTLNELSEYRIVITTLVTAAKLVNLKCPKNHFSYVFIDEAGQSTEAETLIPIARIMSDKEKTGCISGQIVLAGDPRQLGPVIHSTMGKEYGYDTSTLERLIDSCDLYAKNDNNEYNQFALTKLLKNYRSHSAIIDVPNRLFYDNELQVAGDDSINTAINWEHLPNKDFPLIFHSVIGADQREKTSPSFFNIQEIQVIDEYLDRLIGSQMNGVTIEGGHIMIVSPYKKQVEKIKEICSKKNYQGLLIGSVEQVQGQERLVVIVSAVRSKLDLVQYDEKFHLGFLKNPKRFNVAITRAKALLIVVGNPNLLQFDIYWKRLVEYCRNNGAIVGDTFDFEGEPDDTLSDAQNMSLLNEIEFDESANSSKEIQLL